MKNNVINFARDKKVFPQDLISFKGFAEKHDMKIGYLYKLYSRGLISRYKRGVWKISESEVLKVLERVV